MTLPPIVALWIEGTLGPIERLALTSFVVQGHPVALYAYGEIRGLPTGVELRDGRDVLPEAAARANRYANGSYALFSNLFRYELQRRGLGIWVDTDVVAIRPVTLAGPFIAGWESDRFINGAVLHAAPDSPFVADALAAFGSGGIPPWVPFSRAPRAYLRRLVGQPIAATELPHGTFGPKGVTALARRHGLTGSAQPPEVFYPVHPRRAREVFESTLALDAVVTPQTITIHLWNEKLRDLRGTSPAPGSILRTLYERYGI